MKTTTTSLLRIKGSATRLPIALLGSSIALLGGCQATILKPTEADDSRRLVQRLEGENSQLLGRIEQLEMELELARRASGDTPSSEPQSGLPIPTKLEIGRLSGPVWNPDGRTASEVRIYLRPLDARGRFVHPLGALTVELLAWPASGDPRVIGSATYAEAALADLYRSGLTGTHYTVEVALDSPLDQVSSLIIRLRLEDDLTGRTTTLQRVIDPRRAASARSVY